MYLLFIIILPFALYFFAKLSHWILDCLMSKVDTEFERYLIIIGFVAVLLLGIIMLN